MFCIVKREGIYSIISGGDYKISASDYIILTTDYIISATDYRINGIVCVFYWESVWLFLKGSLFFYDDWRRGCTQIGFFSIPLHSDYGVTVFASADG